jgi:hypothetical protein
MKETGRDTTWNGRCRQIGSGKNKAGPGGKQEGETGRSPIKKAVDKHVHITPFFFTD